MDKEREAKLYSDVKRLYLGTTTANEVASLLGVHTYTVVRVIKLLKLGRVRLDHIGAGTSPESEMILNYYLSRKKEATYVTMEEVASHFSVPAVRVRNIVRNNRRVR